MAFPLSQLPEGERAFIHTLYVTGGIRRRLQDLGFVPGTQVICLQRALAGNPIAYQIRGAVIALREQDARQVEVSGQREGWREPKTNPADPTNPTEMGEDSCVKVHL